MCKNYKESKLMRIKECLKTILSAMWKHYANISFPGNSDGKESTCNARDLGSIPGWRRSPGEVKSYPLQYSDPENSVDCIVHGVTKSWT